MLSYSHVCLLVPTVVSAEWSGQFSSCLLREIPLDALLDLSPGLALTTRWLGGQDVAREGVRARKRKPRPGGHSFQI